MLGNNSIIIIDIIAVQKFGVSKIYFLKLSCIPKMLLFDINKKIKKQ